MFAALVNPALTSETPTWLRPEPRQRSIFSSDELPAVLGDVIDVMERMGYAAADRFAVHLALEEAAVNAVKHGHRFDPCKQVRIWWDVTPSAVRLVVEDEGPGFDPAQVP